MSLDKIIRIDEGGVWDENFFDIRMDVELGKWQGHCRHVQNDKLKYVVVAINEGGYNNTGVCGECVSEAIIKLNNKDYK
jgi:hypothetical protein